MRSKALIAAAERMARASSAVRPTKDHVGPEDVGGRQDHEAEASYASDQLGGYEGALAEADSNAQVGEDVGQG